MDISCWQRGCEQRDWFTACAVWSKRFHATLIYTPIGLMIRYLVLFTDNPNCSVRGLGRSETRALTSQMLKLCSRAFARWTAAGMDRRSEHAVAREDFFPHSRGGAGNARHQEHFAFHPCGRSIEAYAASRCPFSICCPVSF